MQTITVAIAGPDSAGLLACRRMLRADPAILVVGQTNGAIDLVTEIRDLNPRILLFSVGLCAAADCGVLRTLRRDCPATRVLLLPDHRVKEIPLLHALAVGACGYLERDVVERQLVQAVHGLDRGEAWVPRRMLGRFLDIVLR